MQKMQNPAPTRSCPERKTLSDQTDHWPGWIERKRRQESPAGSEPADERGH